MFESKTVVITGAASGIGRCAAIEFARLGANLELADTNVLAGSQTMRKTHGLGASSTFFETDVTDTASIEKLIQNTVDEYGTPDCVINNAGIELEWAPLAEADESHFDQIIAVNLKGVWQRMKHELGQMLQQSQGVIVNTASIAAMAAAPKMSAYSASKHSDNNCTHADRQCQKLLRTR